MIIPNSKQYWELRDKIEQENGNRYKYAIKMNSKDGRIYKSGKNLALLYPEGPDAFDASYIEVDVDYVYRAVSPEELDYINRTGYIKSNQSMNMGYEVEQGFTCFEDDFPRFLFTKNRWLYFEGKSITRE